MGGRGRLKGQWANVRDIAYPATCSMLRIETEDGASTSVTVVVEPIRQVLDVTDPPLESEAQAIIEYGPDQGTTHIVKLDCSRGLVLTLSCVHLKLDIQNVGAGQAENVPKRRWKASASVGSTSRVTPAVLHERFSGLGREAWSDYVFVPAFAFAWTFPRTPQGPMAVSFEGGAGQVLADYFIPRNADPRHQVPVGADRVRVRALDDGLTRGRLQFELAI